jgi:hypothetical protein
VFGVTQGVCNHWDCPRCGPLIAKKHYGRIVEGARELRAEGMLYFLTLTCRGREITRHMAEESYLKWTNRVLTAMRTRAKRAGQRWAYVQVTERQKRGHPHSHILTTWKPHDTTQGTHRKWRVTNDGQREPEDRPALRSEWLEARCVAAGLGPQYDITEVSEVEAASRYVAKYLFKDTLLTVWPKGWKRVRYSQSWPRLPEQETDARVLLTAEDWYYLAEDAVTVTVPQDQQQTVIAALDGLYGHDVFVRSGDYLLQFGKNRAGNLAAWRKQWVKNSENS